MTICSMKNAFAQKLTASSQNGIEKLARANDMADAFENFYSSPNRYNPLSHCFAAFLAVSATLINVVRLHKQFSLAIENVS